MKSWHFIAAMLPIWAGIYLTHLGTHELRGEEARRILPAQEMLETGDWIVPRIAGEVYANKPPLMNWAIAGSFALTGIQSEWTARLPSVVAILVLGVAAWFLLRPAYGRQRAALVGPVLFTILALLDKGRMAGIEPVLVALFGLACFSWIALWTGRRPPWWTWTLPYLFLGLACLAKGPVHLPFWVLFLLFTLRGADGGGWRQLLHPAHFVGIGIMLALFLPWTFLNMAAVDDEARTAGAWVDQLAKRLDYSDIDWTKWAGHPVEMLVNFLPWTVPLLFALWCRHRDPRKPFDPAVRKDAVTRGILPTLVAGAGLICLSPEGLPRYVMPLHPLAALATIDLFHRLPAPTREGYERFARWFMIGLAALLAVAAGTGLVVALRRERPVDAWEVLFGMVLLLACIEGTRRTGARISFVWHPGAVFAAGVVAVFPVWMAFHEHDYRRGAAEISAVADDPDAPIVLYADETYRRSRPAHLRVAFYLREPSLAIGESSAVPEDTRLLVGRQAIEETLRRRVPDSLRVSREERVVVEGLPFVALRLEQR